MAGVDGGFDWEWVVVLQAPDGMPEPLDRLLSFEEVLALDPAPEMMAVHIPIGLPDEGTRLCEEEARSLLGRRARAVFRAPVRAALEAPSFEHARRISRRRTGRQMTPQVWAMCPRIRVVDRLMTPALQARVREVQPELSFMSLRGRPCGEWKATPEGRRERRRILDRHAPGFSARPRPAYVSEHAYLDAAAASLIARRILQGKAKRVPKDPPRDARGLRMEIWY